jgi:hypothetical protein
MSGRVDEVESIFNEGETGSLALIGGGIRYRSCAARPRPKPDCVGERWD